MLFAFCESRRRTDAFGCVGGCGLRRPFPATWLGWLRSLATVLLLSGAGHALGSGEAAKLVTPQFDPEAWDRSALLLRDPAVQEELGLGRAKAEAIRPWMDAADGALWADDDLPPAEVQAKQRTVLTELERKLKSVLTAPQQKRFAEITLQWQGLPLALKPEFGQKLNLTAEQQARIRAVMQNLPEALKQAANDRGVGRGRDESLNAVVSAANARMRAVLTAPQQRTWERLAGAPFDFSRVKPLALKAPELRPGHDWINSKPLTLAGLRGHVVVLHFYTFGCGNCLHNYPAYKSWTESFGPKGVTILGIHTPESQGERDIAKVRAKARENDLRFPILVDDERKNWKAWGNSMWPAVYLIDKRGYVRQSWFGELNWQGATGQAQMTQAIQALLAEQ